jgi:hypothetical protein
VVERERGTVEQGASVGVQFGDERVAVLGQAGLQPGRGVDELQVAVKARQRPRLDRAVEADVVDSG